MQQTTDTILMVRPSQFRKNEDTAVNNYFQAEGMADGNTQGLALAEFNQFVQSLLAAGVRVIVAEDPAQLDTPDSIFPNNVISFHGKRAVLYPMFAPNRRLERNLNLLGTLEKQGFDFEKIIDYSIYEDEGLFLEGTGVLVLDRLHQVAYCSLSPRASEQLVHRFCADFGFMPLVFEASQDVDGERLPIYHTNVMMALGTDFCVVCLESISDSTQRALLQASLQKTGKHIIEISEEQMYHFCGNILELKSKNGKTIIAMSEQAFKHFTADQRSVLSSFGEIIHSPLYTIEKYGGGSARCMIAEVFYYL